MRSTSDSSREPCPDRIIDDFGSSFAMGAIGGSIFHFVRGSMNTPKGERFSGGIQSMRMKAPRMASAWAAWFGLVSTLDCAMVYIRQKEDPWNSILAGAGTSGLLRLRAGLRPACSSAAFGGALFAGMEGVMIVVNKFQPIVTDDPSMMGGMPMPGQQSGDGGDEELKTGWFRGLFGGKNKEESSSSSGGGGGSHETMVLESFESPTPMPNFDYKSLLNTVTFRCLQYFYKESEIADE